MDRPKLKRRLLGLCKMHGVTFLRTKASGIEHREEISVVRCSNNMELRASLVVDAAGFSRTLVEFDKEFDPGYQGAYGVVAEVESHPFPVDKMLFMDWRDEHTQRDPAMKESNSKLPTFLYAMPFSDTKIFLEETSLVAKPVVGFKDLKERFHARMEHLGIKVEPLPALPLPLPVALLLNGSHASSPLPQIKHIEEEEYCLIPMGGELPSLKQRTLAVGGAAGLVHPSTGYMAARVLSTAPIVAGQ